MVLPASTSSSPSFDLPLASSETASCNWFCESPWTVLSASTSLQAFFSTCPAPALKALQLLLRIILDCTVGLSFFLKLSFKLAPRLNPPFSRQHSGRSEQTLSPPRPVISGCSPRQDLPVPHSSCLHCWRKQKRWIKWEVFTGDLLGSGGLVRKAVRLAVE
jgi:hypothetical protein